MHLRIIVRVTAACLALAACDSATGSRPVEGTYTLRSVNGRPVPATVDSVVWNDGVTYSVDVLAGSSVEILGADSARYTLSERTVTHLPSGDIVFEASCISIPMRYRLRSGGLILIADAAQLGRTGRLRLAPLRIADETLVLDTQSGSGAPIQLEYVASTQPARCAEIDP